MRYRFYEPETKKYQRFTSFSDHLHSLHVSFHNFQYQYLTALFFHLPLKLNDAAFFLTILYHCGREPPPRCPFTYAYVGT